MSVSQTINKEVNVNAWYFRQRRGGSFRSFPKQIEFNGQQVRFQESGLQLLIQHGEAFIKLFDMTDGDQRYRLRFDPIKQAWTLLTIDPAPRAL